MFRWIDGQEFWAEDERDLIAQSNRASFMQRATDEKWMWDVATRAKLYGAYVRIDSPEHFVADLIGAGLLEELTPTVN